MTSLTASPLRLRMNGTYPSLDGPREYHVHAVPAGFGLMFIAGTLSGLLGIGSGAVKVLAMDRIMRIPFKVSTTTSNFMIGVTAAAGAGVYLSRGYIDPGIVMPVMLGVLPGSLLGARVLVAARTTVLRLIFGGVILLLGVEMIYNGIHRRVLKCNRKTNCYRRTDGRRSSAPFEGRGDNWPLLVVLAGGILYLVRHGVALPEYKVFNGEPEEFKSVSGIIVSAGRSGPARGFSSDCLSSSQPRSRAWLSPSSLSRSSATASIPS